jgi:hypothetical protein
MVRAFFGRLTMLPFFVKCSYDPRPKTQDPSNYLASLFFVKPLTQSLHIFFSNLYIPITAPFEPARRKRFARPGDIPFLASYFFLFILSPAGRRGKGENLA